MIDTTLDRNLDALTAASREVCEEFKPGTDSKLPTRQRSVQRFYYLLLMECAERMTVADFRKSIEVAREQLRKPIA